MKKILINAGIVIPVILAFFLIGLYFWMGQSVKKNIARAQDLYPGTAEEALVSFLLDTTNSTHERTHTAIWTLGQIRSEKALPILHELYRDDPEGKTCYGFHDSMLCQYEIHKAIIAIENRQFFCYSRLNKKAD
jgi:hypothetical protein